METVLDKINATKRKQVGTLKSKTSLESLKQQITELGQNHQMKPSFQQALLASSPWGLITEIKKASPSAGVIREDFNPSEIAQAYEQAGASCLSVLTDEDYFQGKNEYLIEALNSCNLPILRKDFMIDPWQIYESRLLGASCILIIVASLSDQEANDMINIAQELGMDALVEVHDHVELERALNYNSRIIGVNNRNLKTLKVDLAIGEELLRLIPSDYFAIAESGLKTVEDFHRMHRSGAQAFLVGESLMRQNDIKKATEDLRNSVGSIDKGSR